MNEELNCMNCSIGDFKHSLCDSCDDGFCKEFKSIGTEEDFFNAVMERIRPQGEWVVKANGNNECSICGREKQDGWVNFCGFCGAKMKGADDVLEGDR